MGRDVLLHDEAWVSRLGPGVGRECRVPGSEEASVVPRELEV